LIVEASALHAPALARRPLSTPLLRLRSDEQLVALFRAGSDDAFAAMHDRYRQRLFAYVRQMLSVATRADAEDVLQDVFVRAYGALRNDSRDINLRAWLYRVAHNRCIDHLRRPTPPASEIYELSRTPLQDPIETAQRRDDLRRLVEDVGRLPEQQRSALLMREIEGVAYADIAEALDVTVPAVKSLLVRARVGLVEAIQARDTDCAVIRADLMDSYDRGVKASGRARRHMRECDGCREHRTALRSLRRSFAALSPVAGFGPVALLAKALGVGGAGGGSAAVGGAGVATTGAATATACKVAAVVCTAALATGGAVEVRNLTQRSKPSPAPAPAAAAREQPAPASSYAAPAAGAALSRRMDTAAHERTALQRRDAVVPAAPPAPAKAPVAAVAPAAFADPAAETVAETHTGGAAAPEDETAKPTDPIATANTEVPVAPPLKNPGVAQDPSAPADPVEAGGIAPPQGRPPPEH